MKIPLNERLPLQNKEVPWNWVVTQWTKMAQFVDGLLSFQERWNAPWTSANTNSLEFYRSFYNAIKPNDRIEMAEFIRDNWGFCLDIWCGYMQVWRQLVRDFDIGWYVWIDSVDHPKGSVFLSNPIELPPLWKNEYFLRMDIFSKMQHIPHESIPLVLVNNFDSTWFHSSSKWFTAWWEEKKEWFDTLFIDIHKILVPWGYLVAIGTTLPLAEEYYPLWFHEMYESIGIWKELFRKKI
jgi:SAM-dependent methyltransferase